MKSMIFILTLLTYLMAGQDLFQYAYNEWNDSLFAIAERSFNSNSTEHIYWRNVVRFHRINFYLFGHEKDKDRKKAKELIQISLKELEALEKQNSFRGEVPALLATLRGIRITLQPMTAMAAGPKVQKEMKRAFAADSTNPRSLYLLGISYYFTPKMLGGGFHKSKHHLSRSIASFRREASNGGVSPDWGYSTTLAFMGEIHLKEKEYKKAKQWYDEALRVNPNDQLAKLGLATLKEKRQ